MSTIIVGLGNPGQEYEGTRHNTGRVLVEWFGKEHGAEWKTDKKVSGQTAKIKVAGESVTLLLPDTFMNNSGKSVKPLITSAKTAEKMLVVYDDLDLPFGTAKMSFNKSSGGHRGLESIIKSIKTEKFSRIRVGIAPTSPTGKIRKPQGEEKVLKHIMGKFKPEEVAFLKKLSKKMSSAIEILITSGRERAMTEFN